MSKRTWSAAVAASVSALTTIALAADELAVLLPLMRREISELAALSGGEAAAPAAKRPRRGSAAAASAAAGGATVAEDELLCEYLRFIELKRAYPKESLSPSRLVDRVWHCHILCTRQYAAFCERILDFGGFLHHDPNVDPAPLYPATYTRYEEFFGEAPPERWWPLPLERADGAAKPAGVAGGRAAAQPKGRGRGAAARDISDSPSEDEEYWDDESEEEEFEDEDEVKVKEEEGAGAKAAVGGAASSSAGAASSAAEAGGASSSSLPPYVKSTTHKPVHPREGAAYDAYVAAVLAHEKGERADRLREVYAKAKKRGTRGEVRRRVPGRRGVGVRGRRPAGGLLRLRVRRGGGGGGGEQREGRTRDSDCPRRGALGRV